MKSALSQSEALPQGPFSGDPISIKGLEDEKGVVNDYGPCAWEMQGLPLLEHYRRLLDLWWCDYPP